MKLTATQSANSLLNDSKLPLFTTNMSDIIKARNAAIIKHKLAAQTRAAQLYKASAAHHPVHPVHPTRPTHTLTLAQQVQLAKYYKNRSRSRQNRSRSRQNRSRSRQNRSRSRQNRSRSRQHRSRSRANRSRSRANRSRSRRPRTKYVFLNIPTPTLHRHTQATPY